MRRLHVRIDEKLHARLKGRATAEHRSLNSLVGELLEDGVAKDDARARLRRRAEVLGLRYVPPRPSQPSASRGTVIATTRGWGTTVSKALAEDRVQR